MGAPVVLNGIKVGQVKDSGATAR
ncbi:MAG: hypothetical protein WKG07_49495 [Hymenobacter sp.]